MPLVKIEILQGKTEDYKKAIMDGIHDALVKAIKIPDYDRMQRLYELNPVNFEYPTTKSDQITIIEITMFKGRSDKAKRQLYQEIVANLSGNPGISGNDIVIVVHEPPLENWGIRGGKPANEAKLEFEINV